MVALRSRLWMQRKLMVPILDNKQMLPNHYARQWLPVFVNIPEDYIIVLNPKCNRNTGNSKVGFVEYDQC